MADQHGENFNITSLVDLFDEINYDDVSQLVKQAPEPQVKTPRDNKGRRLTAKQIAKSPMARPPIKSTAIDIHIKSSEKTKPHIVKGGALILSNKLSDWRKKNPDQNEIIMSSSQSAETSTGDDVMLSYVAEYFNIWDGYYLDADYQIKLPIRTSDVSQVLYLQDWQFLERYISREAQYRAVEPLTDINYMTHATQLNQHTKSQIKALSRLLYVAEYFEITSLEKKIMVYCAALLYDKTAVDVEAFKSSI
jgi:hypothetical protein